MKLTARWGARALQLAFRLLPSTPDELTFRGSVIKPANLSIPTRHGPVSCELYQSPQKGELKVRPPVYLNFHGGAFIVQEPQQDAHVCRYLAASCGAVVVNVDYDTAPARQYPVAEHQAYDVFAWLQQHGHLNGWNGDEIVVGGFSAGAKLAVNVCQQARDASMRMPLGLVACYPAVNMTLPVRARTELLQRSRAPDGSRPAVAPWLIKLMYDTYFENAGRRAEPLASPELDTQFADFPPTLVLTGGLDAVGPEAERFAHALEADGVDVRLRRFEGSDHGMTHNLPADTAREALELIAEHLVQVFATTFSPSFFTSKELQS